MTHLQIISSIYKWNNLIVKKSVEYILDKTDGFESNLKHPVCPYLSGSQGHLWVLHLAKLRELIQNGHQLVC